MLEHADKFLRFDLTSAETIRWLIDWLKMNTKQFW